MIDKVLLIFTLFLSFGNCCMMVAVFLRFLSAPHKNIMTRIEELEKKVKDLEEDSSETKKALQVIMHSVLALLEFEMQYCLTEHKDMTDGLKKAKEDLHSFLSDR